MDSTDVLAAHTKTIIAASAVYFGFTLSEWAAIFGIIFAVANTIAVLPSTVRTLRQLFNKEDRRNGGE